MLRVLEVRESCTVLCKGRLCVAGEMVVSVTHLRATCPTSTPSSTHESTVHRQIWPARCVITGPTPCCCDGYHAATCSPRRSHHVAVPIIMHRATLSCHHVSCQSNVCKARAVSTATAGNPTVASKPSSLCAQKGWLTRRVVHKNDAKH